MNSQAVNIAINVEKIKILILKIHNIVTIFLSSE